MKYDEKRGCVICGSQNTAENLMRIILGLTKKNAIQIPADKDAINIGGMSAVRVDVSDIPARFVQEAIRKMDSQGI